ncbi:hypothetical protein GCM10010276_53620 [Streptomyces longisporus]|uniref:Secreted protein n=2 Tax=Streptomyces longisporus TaxID=1948 RepID=A0ABN3MK97_STRLO
MRKICKGVGVAAAALTLAVTLPASAEADTLQPSCSTTGANGTVTVPGFSHKATYIVVALDLYDSLADGHHVRIRLITKDANKNYTYWPWHADYDGKGSSKEWNTSAKDSNGFINVAAQVARFDGDNLLNSCTAWALGQTPLHR